jgi:hypothetical protein
MGELAEVISKCAGFWGDGQNDRHRYMEFAKTIKPYIDIRFKPKPVNSVGEQLLENGLFVLAFIKYVSLSEVSHDIKA